MTRINQICRSWISRRRPGGTFTSHVSIAGRRHTLTTGTTHRRAAREFNLLHLRSVLGTPDTRNHTQTSTTPELL